MQFTWTGYHWYAREFSVRTSVNSVGFRDAEHSASKPPGVVRVALLGDSFVEALQVPFEKTAGRVLERRLAATNAGRFEVLNFGISNYGIGQSVLAWEQHARRYAPDYVFLLVGGMHFNRTVNEHEGGGFSRTADLRLSIRPVFDLVEGRLVRKPARDYDRFVVVQRTLLAEDLGGRRTTRISTPWLLKAVTPAFSTRSRRPREKPAPRRTAWGGVDPKTVQIGMTLIADLARDTRLGGANLVVVDYVRYLDAPSVRLSDALRRTCRANEIGYVDLTLYLASADRGGRKTSWPYDGHFNEAGHEAFAEEAMHAFLADRLSSSAPAGAPRAAIQ